MRITEIEHPTHPLHQLKLESSPVPYICDGCKELGFGICYQCQICNFHLHKECGVASSSFYHRFFKGCEFKFYEESPRLGARVCDGCWRDIGGFVYQCSHERANDLHPPCAKLPATLAGEGMKLVLKENVKSKCLKCKSRRNSSKGSRGWCYVSDCGKFCFHVACVKEMVYEAWEMGYFDRQETEPDPNVDGSVVRSLVPSGLSSSTEMVQPRPGKAMHYWKMVASVLKLILSAIFGDPITAFATLIFALAQSLATN
ncbi:uncharacterized protein LOC110619067 [Manihot esculenta]|uniref:Phorbol-ester/DAG-type domain-containing protein n=1 Tax=Manihot esculenta TaxID=3983 RepID=A0A2C9VM08_MANES|nr:uncharacterized protein LOC110619067 [Manihot esculenta]OAY46089.1 hypothetical protein MANES_07G115600v8 [Manihot esculenta]